MLRKNHDLVSRDSVLSVLLLAVVVLFFSLSTFAQASVASSDSPPECDEPANLLKGKTGKARLFTSGELLKRAVSKKKVQRPSALGTNRIHGVAKVQVVIDQNGKVICTTPQEGHPIGLVAAEQSVKHWLFKPYRAKGRRWSIFGILSVPFDFR